MIGFATLTDRQGENFKQILYYSICTLSLVFKTKVTASQT